MIATMPTAGDQESNVIQAKKCAAKLTSTARADAWQPELHCWGTCVSPHGRPPGNSATGARQLWGQQILLSIDQKLQYSSSTLINIHACLTICRVPSSPH